MKRILILLIVLFVSLCAFAENRLTVSALPYSRSAAGAFSVDAKNEEVDALLVNSRYGTGLKMRYEYKKSDRNFTVGGDLNYKFYKNRKLADLLKISDLETEDLSEAEDVLSEYLPKKWSELDLLANIGWNWNTDKAVSNVGGFLKMGFGCSWIIKPGKNVFSLVPIDLDFGFTYNVSETINLDCGLESIVFLSYGVKKNDEGGKASLGFGISPYIGATYRF